MNATRATTTTSPFTKVVTVTTDIDAPPEQIWKLLTDAPDLPSWNTTVTSVEGPIELGRKLELRVPGSERTFRPKVTGFDPPRSMTWSDGFAPMFKGTRVYTLQRTATGTRFTMTETFAGILLPLIGRTLPDFAPVFDQYAADLKQGAEQQSTRDRS